MHHHIMVSLCLQVDFEKEVYDENSSLYVAPLR